LLFLCFGASVLVNGLNDRLNNLLQAKAMANGHV